MIEWKLKSKGKVSIKGMKTDFLQKFPNSPLASLLLSLPDQMEAEELIGAVGVWLSILDAGTQHSFNCLMRNIKGGKE